MEIPPVALQDLGVDGEVKATDGLNGVGAVLLVNNFEFLPGLDLSCIGMEVHSVGEAPSAYGSDIVPAASLESVRPVAQPDERELRVGKLATEMRYRRFAVLKTRPATPPTAVRKLTTSPGPPVPAGLMAYLYPDPRSPLLSTQNASQVSATVASV